LTPVPQGGAIAFRRDGAELDVLLVRAKQDARVWIFPKGHIEAGEDAAAAAVRELSEEAGVTGDVVGPVGAPLEFESGRERVSVQYFLVEARGEVSETDGREKAWVPIAEALRRIPFEDTRRLLIEAQRRLAG